MTPSIWTLILNFNTIDYIMKYYAVNFIQKIGQKDEIVLEYSTNLVFLTYGAIKSRTILYIFYKISSICFAEIYIVESIWKSNYMSIYYHLFK